MNNIELEALNQNDKNKPINNIKQHKEMQNNLVNELFSKLIKIIPTIEFKLFLQNYMKIDLNNVYSRNNFIKNIVENKLW